MNVQEDPSQIRWRVHLRSAPESVYEMLASPEGRAQFWADTAEENEGGIEFRFLDGTTLHARVLQKIPGERFAVTYFGGSRVEFELASDGAGGTDLTLTERDVPEANRPVHIPGWIPVLLALKAAVDFSVDLRNADPARSWDAGYVDV